jgi:hypothetical protein
LKLVSMRSSRSAEFAVRTNQLIASSFQVSVIGNRAGQRFCSGRLLRRAFFVLSFTTISQTANAMPQQTATKASTRHYNELTLAGLRPGRDTLGRATQLYKAVDPKQSTNDSQTVWVDICARHTLTVDFDNEKKIQVIRTALSPTPAKCRAVSTMRWTTGHGLGVGDSTARLAELYGKPDSKSPSTRDGQPLELWYYAFDWAGPDVPQVMEVLCTREADGQPGHIIEITLAAPSL